MMPWRKAAKEAEGIQKHLDRGTLANEIALMAAVHKFQWPLEIVEDEGL